MTEQKPVDELSGVETTGHEWDGIKELNNPLPRWWLWTFYGTILWAIGYTIAFPAWPLISSATTGLMGYSSRADLEAQLEEVATVRGPIMDRIAQAPLAEIVADDELARFARLGGQSLFKVYCSQCHGTGAAGAAGYPNLNDDEWIWGGTIEAIHQTISHGARWPGDDDTHFNLMPNFGAEALLSGNEIITVSRQVAAMAGLDGGAASPAGAQLFADNCAGCHGDAGGGLTDLGGPSLTDAIWLYAAQGSLADIRAQVSRPRHGVMPAWGDRLGDAAVKQLAVYVHGLGGGL